MITIVATVLLDPAVRIVHICCSSPSKDYDIKTKY